MATSVSEGHRGRAGIEAEEPPVPLSVAIRVNQVGYIIKTKTLRFSDENNIVYYLTPIPPFAVSISDTTYLLYCLKYYRQDPQFHAFLRNT